MPQRFEPPADPLAGADDLMRQSGIRFFAYELGRLFVKFPLNDDASSRGWLFKMWGGFWLFALMLRAYTAEGHWSEDGDYSPPSLISAYGVYILILTFAGGMIGVWRACAKIGAACQRAMQDGRFPDFSGRSWRGYGSPTLEHVLITNVAKQMAFGGIILGFVLERIWDMVRFLTH